MLIKLTQSLMNSNRLKILKNAGWLYQEKILRMLLGFLITAWIARYLGPQEFGQMSYALSFVTLFDSLATLGLPSIIKREIVLDQARAATYLGTSFVMTVVSAFICMVAAQLLSKQLHGQDPVVDSLVSIFSILLLLRAFDLIENWYDSQVRSKVVVLAKTLALLIVSLVRVYLILNHSQLPAFAWVTLFEFALTSLLLTSVYCWQQNKGIFQWKWSGDKAIKMLKDSWPLIFSGVTVFIYMKIDQFMLKMYQGDEAVGIYSAAIRLSEIWYFVPTIIASSAFPFLIECKKKDERDFQQKLEKLLSFVTGLFLLISVPVTLLSPWIINLVFSKDYSSSIPILQVHIWAGLFVFWGVIQGIWDVAYNITGYSLIKSILGGLANILLNIILIPQYSGLGAAWATVLSYSVVNFGMNIFFAPTRPFLKMQLKSLFFFRDIKHFLSLLRSLKEKGSQEGSL